MTFLAGKSNSVRRRGPFALAEFFDIPPLYPKLLFCRPRKFHRLSVFISPFAATGGVNYWLEIFNNATNDAWFWTIDEGGGNSASTEQSTDWQTIGDEHTFQLTDDVVPETGSLAIWGIITTLGIVAVQRARFWRHQSDQGFAMES
jgi:hypothetical protein